MRVAQVFQSYSNMGEYQGEIFNHGGILEKRAEHQGLHNYSQLQSQQGWILGLHKDEVLEKKCWRRHRNIWRCIVNATGDLPMASIPRISSLPPSKKLWNESDKDLKSEEKFFALIELLLDLIEAIWWLLDDWIRIGPNPGYGIACNKLVWETFYPEHPFFLPKILTVAEI